MAVKEVKDMGASVLARLKKQAKRREQQKQNLPEKPVKDNE